MAMQDIFSALMGGGPAAAPGAPTPTLTPESVKRRRMQAMMQQKEGMSFAPVQHWTQGAARVSQALLGALDEKDLDRQEATGLASATKSFNDIIGGGGGAAPAAANVPSGGTPGPAAPATAEAGAPDDRAKQAFNYFVQQGHTPAAAAGIVGNLMQESGLRTNAVNPGDGADGSNSIGVAQWNGPRAQALQQFAKAQGKDVGDFNTQLAFVQNELQGPENRVMKALQGVKDPTAAAGIFAGYERPQGWKDGGDPSAIHGWQNRSGQAQRLFAALSGPAPQQPPGVVVPPATGDNMAVQPPAVDPGMAQKPVQVASADPSFVPQMAGQRPPQQMAQAPQAAPSGAGVDQGNPMVAQVTQLAAQPQVQQAAQAHAQTPEGQKMVQQAGGASLPQIMQAMQNPWMSEGQKSLLLMVAKQKMEAMDPVKQRMNALQMQKLEQDVSGGDPLTREGKVISNQKGRLELSGVPLTQEGQRLENEKKRRDLEGEGATPLSDQERQAYGIPRNQPAYKTRSGEVKFGPAGTTIKNEGAVPPGYRAERDADGNVVALTPIPGSKEAKAETMQQGQVAAQANTVIDAVDQISKKLDSGALPTTGGMGNYLASVPGTNAHDIAKMIETVKANVTFEALNRMRQASPTGGALGAVSDKEGELLGNSIASLAQSQSAEQFKRNLQIVKDRYLDVIHGPGNRPKPAGAGAAGGFKILSVE